MKRDLYFKELAVVLGRAGFTPLPQENDFLPVEYHGQRLCRVNAQGNVFYRQEEVDSPEREQARVKVTDIVRKSRRGAARRKLHSPPLSFLSPGWYHKGGMCGTIPNNRSRGRRSGSG